MNITFIGTGYVGLVSGILMSHLGHNVTCVDYDSDKIAGLANGILPIYEPGLAHYLEQGLKSGRLKFTDAINEDIKSSKAVFITVGTPSMPTGEADLEYVFTAVESLLQKISLECVIVIKSTVPPSALEQISQFIINKGGKRFSVASNPEFLREGSAVEDFLNPERIVIGTEDKEAGNLLKEIYRPLTDKNIPLISTDSATAALIKYAANAFLATKIAFINEMADLCECAGADIEKLSLGLGLDSRIGSKFLKAGPGFGGSCFPKDILALAHFANKHETRSLVVEAVIESNIRRSKNMVNKICQILDGRKDIKLAILGLSYKAGTDDVRSSPALGIIELLQKQGYAITAYDPEGMENAANILVDIKYASSALGACKEADGVVILTEWPEFAALDFDKLKDQLKEPIIIDLRNMLDPDLLKNKGFKYYSLGQRSTH